MVRKGISPHGTLFVARARHSFGGTDCRKCSTAGNSSTGSRICFSRSCGIFLASFQTHLRTSSATLASCESGLVPFAGKGFTILNNRANKALCATSMMTSDSSRVPAYRKMDILLPVANKRRMIILMNRDRSLTLPSGLLSVCSRRSVSSSSKEVKISTVSDSAR